MPITGLDHVQVAAPRTPDTEARARAFYGDLLGLREIEKPESVRATGGVWFTTAAGDLHIGLEEPFSPARKAHPAFVVEGLAALRATLEAAGVAISEAQPIPGVNRFYVHDPFGNRVELMEESS